MTKVKHIYRVTFLNQGEVFDVYARNVSQGALFGFIEIEEFVFGANTSVVIDPSQERLEKEFAGVKRSYIPMHSIVRIDEVEKEGIGRIRPRAPEDNVRDFPSPIYTPTPKKEN